MIGNWARKKHPQNQHSFFIKVNYGRGFRSLSVLLYTYRVKDVDPLASVTATTTLKETELVTLASCGHHSAPCFRKMSALKSSSDLDLPQHSVDLPAHRASLESLALWMHGLGSVH